jgi:hypothetical protein
MRLEIRALVTLARKDLLEQDLLLRQVFSKLKIFDFAPIELVDKPGMAFINLLSILVEFPTDLGQSLHILPDDRLSIDARESGIGDGKDIVVCHCLDDLAGLLMVKCFQSRDRDQDLLIQSRRICWCKKHNTS